MNKENYSDYEDGYNMLCRALFLDYSAYTTKERLLKEGFTQDFINKNIVKQKIWMYYKKQWVVQLDKSVDIDCFINFTYFYILPDQFKTDEDFIITRDYLPFGGVSADDPDKDEKLKQQSIKFKQTYIFSEWKKLFEISKVANRKYYN